jgi:hypothetical protein
MRSISTGICFNYLDAYSASVIAPMMIKLLTVGLDRPVLLLSKEEAMVRDIQEMLGKVR